VFKFDLTGVDLKGAKRLTAVASYSDLPAGTHNALAISSPFAAPIDLVLTSTSLTVGPPVLSGQNLTLTWSGGTPPYQVQSRSNLSVGSSWSNLGSTTSQTTVTVPMGGTQGYFRVQGQ
jgi:hypothetical protein